MDIGYGTISDRETLMDTYTGGLNAITGLSSDAVRAMDLSLIHIYLPPICCQPVSIMPSTLK